MLPLPTKRTLCKTDRKLWKNLESRSLGEQAQGNGEGERQRTGYSCPAGSQLLVSMWTVSLPWPTKLDTICSQLSPLWMHLPPVSPLLIQAQSQWIFSLSLKHTKLNPTQHCESSMFAFPPYSYVEATTPHAMVLGHGVFGRLLGVDEVMRVVPPGGNVCP